jgi:hypothetical protein
LFRLRSDVFMLQQEVRGVASRAGFSSSRQQGFLEGSLILGVIGCTWRLDCCYMVILDLDVFMHV